MNPYLPFSVNRTAETTPRIRILCFPHAGGGASAYRDWPARFPSDIDVQPVQLPGRESLIRQEPFTSATALVELLGTALAAEFDRPYALFGHSMGGLLAAELTAWLLRHGHPPPILLIVSGRAAPPDPPRPDGDVPDDDAVVRRLIRLGGTAPAVLLNPELRELVIHTARADFTLCDAYRPSFRELPVPILAFGGQDDPDVPGAALAAWRRATSESFRIHTLPGGHFFLRDHLPAMAGVIMNELDRLTAPDSPAVR